MDLNALRQFLVYCGKNGYATMDEAIEEPELDGSTTIILEQGAWKLRDNYNGGEPFGGKSVAFLDEKDVWIMVYYGGAHENVRDIKPIYTFLKRALVRVPEEAPYRGPSIHIEGDWRYENTWLGSLERFSGREIIYYKGKVVYSANYAGGVINIR